MQIIAVILTAAVANVMKAAIFVKSVNSMTDCINTLKIQKNLEVTSLEHWINNPLISDKDKCDMFDKEIDKNRQKAWSLAEEELYFWIHETVQEWYDLKIINNKQMLAMKDLLHEIDKRVYYIHKANS